MAYPILLPIAFFGSLVFAQQPSIYSADYVEPQFISSQGDAEFLVQFNFDPVAGDDTRNYLFVAQDGRGPKRLAKRKTFRETGGEEVAPALASRGDIILVISVNRILKKWTIFSFYRGTTVPAHCGGGSDVGLSGSENYLANFYLKGGRRLFIPCIQRMMRDRIAANPSLARTYGLSADTFTLNGFFEGTKEETIRPLASAVKGVVLSWWGASYFGWLYGEHLEDGLSVIMNRDDIKRALAGEVNADQVAVSSDYLYVEAKERDAYRAAGFQRAFNFAKMIADFLGWVAYGAYYDSEIWTYFEEAFNGNISHSLTLSEFMEQITVDGENLLPYAGYREGRSLVDVVQFGYTAKEMATATGEISGSRLKSLRTDIQILKAVPNLD